MRALTAFALLLITSYAEAQAPLDREPPRAAALPGEDALPPEAHVTPPASPTRVGVGLYVHSLDRVDPPSSVFPHFAASGLLTLRWRDPRLAFDAEAEGARRRVFQGREARDQLHEIWHPDIGIENEDGERHVDGRTLTVRSDGTIIYEEVFSSTLRARVDLRSFPFDAQRFHFAVQSHTWNVNKVELENIADKTGFRDGQRRGSLEWQVRAMESEVLRVEAARSGHPHARAAFFLVAHRSPGFYLWKLMLPLLLIVCLTWSTFWMSGELAGTRLQRAFIAMLSLVAYHQVVAGHLPRIPYLTFMDSMVYLAFAFTLGTVVQIVATHRLDQAGRKEGALRLDRVSRWAFPLAFVLTIAALGWLYDLRV